MHYGTPRCTTWVGTLPLCTVFPCPFSLSSLILSHEYCMRIDHDSRVPLMLYVVGSSCITALGSDLCHLSARGDVVHIGEVGLLVLRWTRGLFSCTQQKIHISSGMYTRPPIAPTTRQSIAPSIAPTRNLQSYTHLSYSENSPQNCLQRVISSFKKGKTWNSGGKDASRCFICSQQIIMTNSPCARR